MLASKGRKHRFTEDNRKSACAREVLFRCVAPLGGFGGVVSPEPDLTRPAGPPFDLFFSDFSFVFLFIFFDGFWEDSGAILEPCWRLKSIKNALKNVLIF